MCASRKYSTGWVSTMTMSWVALESISFFNSSPAISGYRLAFFGSAAQFWPLKRSDPHTSTQTRKNERAINFLDLMRFSLPAILLDHKLLQWTIARFFHELVPIRGELYLLHGLTRTASQNLRLISTRVSGDENSNP